MCRRVLALVALVTFLSCGNSTTAKSSDNSSCSTVAQGVEAGTVEVLYMHGKQRCATCIAIGDEAAEFVKSLGSDRVVMKSIDYSTSEGEKIADQYEIASSSLIVVKGDKVDNLTAMSFQYARNNPEQFKKNLDKAIKKMLD